MRGVEEASINIMMSGDSHQVSSPDHSLMCGHPQCPQISDLTAAFCSTALQCGLQPASHPHCNYLNLHYASVYQNYTFFKLEVFFYGHMKGSCETKTLFNLRLMSGKWMWTRKAELD